ncbi:MAG: AsmA family protein [Alphaproteobacteria bacterium]|nr:AsmA family protein [Alphaproteobacteria bacterium]
MRLRKSKFLSILRIVGLIIIGLSVALFVALSRVNLETLRGNILTMLRDATGMPVEIDGAVSWKFSMRPRIVLNQVRVANATWAKEQYAFSAEKIVVRLNLISLFRDRPTVQNVRVHDAKINIEKNSAGQYSVEKLVKKGTEIDQEGIIKEPEKYPFKDAGLGGVQVINLDVNFLGDKYSLAGFNIRLMPNKDVREYSGWIKPDTDVIPFIISMGEYNATRKIYPVRVALSTGGDALIADFALEGTSKLPIDFIIRGDIPDANMFGRLFGVDLSDVPALQLNIAGGWGRKKISLRKSSILVRGTELTLSGDYDWGKSEPVLNAHVHSSDVNLVEMFPDFYGKKRDKSGKKLNVFKDIPLFGDFMLGRAWNVWLEFDNLHVYRDMNIRDIDLRFGLKDNVVRVDGDAVFAGGDVDLGVDADIDDSGRLWMRAAVQAENVEVGQILKEIRKTEFLSDLPVNVDLFVLANGRNLSEVMQTITGPVQVYSVGAGYAHSALVAYMYGTDFLTSLRHSIQDLFRTEKKYNQIKISCMALNAKLRDGVFETQNGFAIETNAINIRLGGSLNLGDEEMKLSLTTVPVRGLKLSLTGNVVNSIELTGSLAQPNIKISGAAVAGKVASATGLGLLLAPFTGGIGLVAGAGVGLIAGDLLENWLADVHPCETAMERGAPTFRDDPEWLGVPVKELMKDVLEK